MSDDEYHDAHGEPYRNWVATTPCLNVPARTREKVALTMARAALRRIERGTGLPKLEAGLALRDIATLLDGEGPKS